MNRFLYFLWFYVVSSNLFAQHFNFGYETFYPISPSDPFNNNDITFKNIVADKIVSELYIGESFERDYVRIYKHNELGQVDSIYIPNDRNTQTFTYYPDGKVKTFKSPINKIEETYTYAEDGRILSISSPYYEKYCYYTKSGIDSLVHWVYSDRLKMYTRYSKTEIIYTPEGYEERDYMYDLDSHKYQQINNTRLFEFDDQGRLIKQSYFYNEIIYPDREIVYLENQIECYHYSYRTNDYRSKYVYNFNKEGYLLEEIEYYWDLNNKNWYRVSTSVHNYYEDSSVKNENVDIPDIKICASENNLEISYPKDKGIVYIYDLNGRLVYKKTVSKGISYIPVDSGVYIVVLDDKKVKVKI